jgi:hypothetical protein
VPEDKASSPLLTNVVDYEDSPLMILMKDAQASIIMPKVIHDVATEIGERQRQSGDMDEEHFLTLVDCLENHISLQMVCLFLSKAKQSPDYPQFVGKGELMIIAPTGPSECTITLTNQDAEHEDTESQVYQWSDQEIYLARGPARMEVQQDPSAVHSTCVLLKVVADFSLADIPLSTNCKPMRHVKNVLGVAGT